MPHGRWHTWDVLFPLANRWCRGASEVRLLLRTRWVTRCACVLLNSHGKAVVNMHPTPERYRLVVAERIGCQPIGVYVSEGYLILLCNPNLDFQIYRIFVAARVLLASSFMEIREEISPCMDLIMRFSLEVLGLYVSPALDVEDTRGRYSKAPPCSGAMLDDIQQLYLQYYIHRSMHRVVCI